MRQTFFNRILSFVVSHPVQRGRFSVTTHPPLNLLNIDINHGEKSSDSSNQNPVNFHLVSLFLELKIFDSEYEREYHY